MVLTPGPDLQHGGLGMHRIADDCFVIKMNDYLMMKLNYNQDKVNESLKRWSTVSFVQLKARIGIISCHYSPTRRQTRYSKVIHKSLTCSMQCAIWFCGFVLMVLY